MKTKFRIFIFVAIIAISCQKTMPVALFSTDKQIYLVGEKIGITNLSENADAYLWLAGSNTGTDFNFSPSFLLPGQYTIKLTVSNGKNDDSYSKTITVVEKTSLSVLVKDADANTISQCTINLYGNYDDWYNEENSIEQGITGTNGYYEFENTEIVPRTYYISAVKQITGNYLVNWTLDNAANFTITTTQYEATRIVVIVYPYYKSTKFFNSRLQFSVQ